MWTEDVSRVDGIEKNPVRVRALLRSLARNISTFATNQTIRDDVALGGDESLSLPTIAQYLNALRRIFVIEDAAGNLLILKDKVDADKMKAPSFLMVLTDTEAAYRRKDGVLIVPIGCLKD